MLPDDLFVPTTPDNPGAPAPRKCRRHVWMQGGTTFDLHCANCPAVRDPAKSRRARNNKNRGLAIQRKRIEGLGGTNLAGNNENLDGIGLRFAFESKSGGGAFSERYWRWLTGIPMTADRTPVLIVTDAPGSGHKSRSYVVVRYDDWKDLHGE